jgi:hypothetical protein
MAVTDFDDVVAPVEPAPEEEPVDERERAERRAGLDAMVAEGEEAGLYEIEYRTQPRGWFRR